MQKTTPIVFDTLTHFVTKNAGVELKNRPLGIEGYMSYVKTWKNSNVKVVNLMAGACPEYEIGTGQCETGPTTIAPCKWEVENGLIVESAYLTRDGKTTKRPVENNCYTAVNKIVLAALKRYSITNPEIRFFYSLMIHPKRTSVDELEKMIADGGEHVIGIKVQGTSTASGPADLSPDMARFIAKSGIPFMVHIDYHNEVAPTIIKSMEDARYYLHSINNPMDWISLCIKYGIRASLQHGARNDPEAFRIIKDNIGQFTVGLGPKINGNGKRIVKKTDDFIASVLEGVGPENCTFSSDYPHNENEEDLTREVMALLSASEQEKVFHKNAEQFFGVKPQQE